MSALVGVEDVAALLPDFLPRQRWYAGGGDLPDRVDVVDADVLVEGTPSLLWLLVRVPGDDASYQVVVGVRPLEDTERFLEGKGRSLLGDVDTDDGPMLVYDALVDPELAPTVFELAAPGLGPSHARALNVEQSNTSIVFDEHYIMKLFRRVHEGPNPDAEVVGALASVGFASAPTSVGTWRRGGRDLAVVREFLNGGSDGWHLALTSLRDLYDRRRPPAECGGDFAPEARRLGQVTAQMHVALAEALGTEPGDAAGWAGVQRTQRRRFADEGALDEVDLDAVASVEDGLATVEDGGRSVRVHGDYHLGQVLRTDAGWYVLDFEGEPKLPVAERRVPSSPLRDVAGMLRSFHYAASVGLREYGATGETDDGDLDELADAWEARNSGAFLDGFLAEPGIDDLLPAGERSRSAVLDAFVLSKALYEMAYEHSHRPGWVPIPRRAVERILHGGGGAPAPGPLADDHDDED